ncbi:hypothetical protein RRG08_007369 [Elysia crispata]|uniref:Uncharacterized protein n=1 Tax=Elysia crispata TaxID=231223 RepID=A0AAE1AS23_9GAST|nr:hypothetical protein RRG08_007369 [Elysia crispata]
MRAFYRTTFVLTGSVLNALTTSMLSFYGNLLPYIDSYNYAYRTRISLDVDPLWVSSAYLCTFIIGMIFSSPVEQRFGIYLSILGSDIIVSLSVLSGYFTVTEPLALALVFGGLQGIFVGIAYALAQKLLLQTTVNYGGLATGIMSVGPILGGLLFIGLAFAVINPSNMKPDLTVDSKVFFSDQSLVDRVPIFFLVVGAIKIITTLIGMFLMYIGTREILQNIKQETVGETVPVLHEINGGKAKSKLCAPRKDCEDLPLNGSGARVYRKYEEDEKIQNSTGERVISSKDALTEDTQMNELPQDSGESKCSPSQVEVSPREMIKSARFWLVWLAFVSSNHTNYIHLNLYKQYGQRAISDDSMLVTTGIICNAGMLVVRPLVGIASDRIGIRNTNVILNGASSLFMSLMVLSLHTCPWAYMVLCVLENMGVSPHTMLFSLLAAFEFGKTYCASNMGLIRSGNIPLVLLEPIIVNALIKTIGWDWVFLTGSFASVIATVAIIALEWF